MSQAAPGIVKSRCTNEIKADNFWKLREEGKQIKSHAVLIFHLPEEADLFWVPASQ